MIFTVAIDGPAAAGKGTISRAVADRFNFQHLDTGLLYRAVGRRVLEGTPAEAAAHTLRFRDISRGDLRTQAVADAASQVAVIPEVRAALVAFQREFARREGGAVLDGRDIGTVICPNAEVKLFVTASAEARARRRYSELAANTQDVDYETVLAEVRARDKRDAERENAPMVAAEDAHVLDTTKLDIAAAVDLACGLVSDALNASGQDKT